MPVSATSAPRSRDGIAKTTVIVTAASGLLLLICYWMITSLPDASFIRDTYKPAHAVSTVTPASFKIHVFTRSNIVGLRALLLSLEAADYMGHTVSMRLHVDVGSDGAAHPRTLETCQYYSWPYGPTSYFVRYKEALTDISVLESWFPGPDALHEYSIFLKDELVVHPAWFSWVVQMINAYRITYASSPQSASIVGLCLFQSRVAMRWAAAPIHDRPSLVFDPEPCELGFVVFPEHWRTVRKLTFIRPALVPELGAKKYSSSLTYWRNLVAEASYLRGLYTLYPVNQAYVSSFSVADDGTVVPDARWEGKASVPFSTPAPHTVPVLDIDGGNTTYSQHAARAQRALVPTSPAQRICACGYECGIMLQNALQPMKINTASSLFESYSC